MLVIRGAETPEAKACTQDEALELVECYRAEGRPLREAARRAAGESGYGKNELYELYLLREDG